MRTFSLSVLAAGIALVATPALAQRGQHSGAPGGHGRGMTGMPARGPNVMMHQRGMTGRPAHGPNMRMHQRGMTGRPAHGPNMRMHNGRRGHHPGPNFRHHRMQRGFSIHPFWFGSQFHINNWQVYGFANPGADGRWVRYYDDACLIGRDGRVRDCRYGMDWDRYGEEWEVEDGIPAYRGSRDWNPDDEDYEWAEAHGDRHGPEHGGPHGPGHGGGWDYRAYGQPMAPGHGAAYGGYYGYGAYAYPIVIETITTTGGCGCQEVVEEVYEVRRQRRRPAPRPRPPRRPPPGERG